ncbi:MAG: hypothetical protein KA369_11960 [Spirochaetes bacterium]|nr:hypothetical protein [Spirochaetota bacterium]
MTDTTNIIDSATAETILKWAVTILVAGFIAQFGKKFATYLIEKVKAARSRKKGEAGAVSGETGGIAAETAGADRDRSPAASRAAAEKARLKMEKKKLKNEAKARKKE